MNSQIVDISKAALISLQVTNLIPAGAQINFSSGGAGGGGRVAYSPSLENLSPPFRKKLTIHQGIFTDDNTFIYCTHCE